MAFRAGGAGGFTDFLFAVKRTGEDGEVIALGKGDTLRMMTQTISALLQALTDGFAWDDATPVSR